MTDLFEKLHAALSRLPALPGSFNPWTQANEDDAAGNGPERRLAHRLRDPERLAVAPCEGAADVHLVPREQLPPVADGGHSG